VSGSDGPGGGAPQEDRRHDLILRVVMFFVGLGGFGVLVLLHFRLWAVAAVVIALLIIDEVLKWLVRGPRPRNRSTNWPSR
jgi:hypothetical protein